MRLMQAGSMTVRFMAVVAVWVCATVTLSVWLGSPLPVFLLMTAVVVLSYVYGMLEADGAVWPVAGGASDEPDDDAEAVASSFASHFVAKEFAAARRGRRVTVVMFGFSGFEEFTARHGSVAAAEALREFGRILQRLTRQMNLSARYGWRADSFLSVLSEADATAANLFIERVRSAVTESSVVMPGIEAGIAVYQPHMASPDELVEAAGHALGAARAAAAVRASPPIASPRHRRADAPGPVRRTPAS